MDDKKTDGPASPTATDAEIASAARQLGVNARRSTAVAGKSSGGQVLQSLAHGRSHMVTVEIKRSRRRRARLR